MISYKPSRKSEPIQKLGSVSEIPTYTGHFPNWLLALGVILWASSAAGASAVEPLSSPTTVREDAALDVGSASELLRGYSDEEYVAATHEFPRRPEPPLGEPVPRKIHVAGRVFRDDNRNERFDEDESGLSHVLVTDGERVVHTNDDGVFEFTFEMPNEPHCRFVVATRPTGFKPTSRPVLSIPFDVTEAEYRASFGFVDDPGSRRREFSFIAASDSQFTQPGEMIAIAKDYAQITSAADAAFLVTAGDLTMNGTHYEWDMYNRIRNSSKIDVYDGFGGHDGNCLDPRCSTNYELRIGPPYYSWDYGGVHFLQIVSELGYLYPEARRRHDAWLQADLKAIPQGTPVIVVSHYPLDPAWFDQRRDDGVNVVGQIAAHWHVVMAGRRRGVPVLISAPARGRDWGAYTRTYRHVHVSPDGIRSELRVAGQYRRLMAYAPGPTTVLGTQPLAVLAYDTARKVASVCCRAVTPDGKIQFRPLASRGDWSWHGTFQATSPGRWTIELEATDVTGQVWRRRQSVLVNPQHLAEPSVGGDFPNVLSGQPPRRVARGAGAPLYPLWVKHTGATHVLHSPPVIQGGRVYVAVTNPNAGSPGAGVLCLDAETGEEVWRAESEYGDLRGTVTAYDNKVFAVTGEGWVVAYDAARGEVLWHRPLREDYRQGRPLAINQAPPIPTRHGLLVSDWQKPQFLVDYHTGEPLAQLDGDVGYYAAFATEFDDVMYTACRGSVIALRIPGGEVVWRAEETSRSTSAGVVADGKFLYATQSGVKAVHAATGRPLWHAGVSNNGYQKPVPVIWDNLVLMNGTKLAAIELATGKEVWTVECGTEADRFVRSRRHVLAGSSTPVVAGDLAYFGHDDTSIRAVNKDGQVVWEHRVGTPIKTSPVVSGNLLFVHDYAGNLWCFCPTEPARDEQKVGERRLEQ
jgi:outer membrane protein assembly factor BamB